MKKNWREYTDFRVFITNCKQQEKEKNWSRGKKKKKKKVINIVNLRIFYMNLTFRMLVNIYFRSDRVTANEKM